MEELLEVAGGMGKLCSEGSPRFGGRVKSPIEGRGEDDEHTQV